MSGAGRSPAQTTRTLRQAWPRLLLGAAVLLAAGLIVLLAVPDKAPVGWALVAVAALDLVLALVVRGLVRRTDLPSQEL